MTNAISPHFAGVYLKVDDNWVECSSEGTEVTADEVKKDYETSDKKQAYFLHSDHAYVNLGLPMITTVRDLPVVMTGPEADKFEQASSNNQRRLLNKWFEPAYEFTNVEVEKADNLDLII